MADLISNTDETIRPMSECDVCGGAAVFQAGEIANGIARAFLLCAECAAKQIRPQQENESDIE